MIHEIGVNLKQFFVARNVPFDVLDGPDRRPTTTFGRERVVIEEDRTGDGFETRHLADRVAQGPKTFLTRTVGVKITIYVKSAAPGAGYWEHRRRLETLLDKILIGLHLIAQQRKNILKLKSGKFVDPPDLKESETPGGAVYELLFVFDRGVADRMWDGSPVYATVPITPQMASSPNLTFDGTAHTITRDAGSWIADGFAVVQSIIVSGSASNNGTFGPITVLTDLVMTFASGLTNEGPVAGVTLTGTGVVLKSTTTVEGDGLQETAT